MYKRIIVICSLLTLYSQAEQPLKAWANAYPTGYNIAYLHAKAGIIGLAGYAYLKAFIPHLLEKQQWEDSFLFLPSLQGLVACAGDIICQPKPLAHMTVAAALMYGIYWLINQTECERIYASSDDVHKLKASGSLIATLSVIWSVLGLNRLSNAAAQ